MELTKKLKVASAIYESKLSPIEKIVNLNCIKNLNEDELNVWIESEMLTELIGKVAGLAVAGTVAATGINAMRKRLSPCISNCRNVFKATGNKQNYASCVEKCNSK